LLPGVIAGVGRYWCKSEHSGMGEVGDEKVSFNLFQLEEKQ
jgi:hypothetical protein